MATQTATKHTQTLEECVALCLDCHETCLQMVGYLLEQGSRQATAPRVRLLMDCAAICQTAADFMIRGSLMHGLVCFVCAEICEATAGECGRMGGGDTEDDCMQACRRCAESCRRMAAESGVSVEYINGEETPADFGEAFEEVTEGIQRAGRAGRRSNISDS